MGELLFIAALIAAASVAVLVARSRQQARRRFIESYVPPEGVMRRFRVLRPEVTPAQEPLVVAALRQWFTVCLLARGNFASMPSQLVDDLWHTAILFTRDYEHFCRRAFGRYLHHTPTEAMSSPTVATDGIKRTWRLSCSMEGIDPCAPDRLPLLFAIDGQLAIKNGFSYSTRCEPGSGSYCASHIGCGAGCGSGGSDSDGGSGCGGD